MRKEDTQEYLSDEALEALIRETEEGPMIKAPEYLEEGYCIQRKSVSEAEAPDL